MIHGSFLVPSFGRSDTFTSADLTEDQRAIRDAVDEWAEDKLDEKAAESVEKKDFVVIRSLLRQMGGQGFLGVDVPERFGGIGLDEKTAALVAEQIAKRGGSFATIFSAHTGIGTWPLVHFGTEEQRAAYLPRLVSGEWVAAYLLTEAGAGSDPAAMRTTAKPVEGGYVLNGEKQFGTNGGIADLFTVFAKIPDVGVTAFLVERSSPGIAVGKEERKLGIHGSSTTPVSFTDVFVPASNLLWKPGKGMKIALSILNLGRFKLGAACLGAGRTILDDAVSYAKTRVQHGKPIIEFGLVRQLIAGIAARLVAMDAVVHRTAALLDGHDGIGRAMECAIVKVFCSEMLWWMADANVQIHGGYGFTEEYRAERFLRDARINRIFEGTNEINRLVIFGEIIRLGLLWSLLTPAFWLSVARLSGAKRALLMRVGLMLVRYGDSLKNHQVLVGAVSDRIIDLYVRDSLLAAQAKHPSDERRHAIALFDARSPSATERAVESLVRPLAA